MNESWSIHHEVEQGVEADEAWSTSELRSLSPVFAALSEVIECASRSLARTV